MKRLFISIAALAFIQAASAAPVDDRPDNWNSGDKRAHFVSGVIIGGVVTAYTKSAGNGMVAGCGAGVLGELVDASKYGWKSYHVSYKDATVECLGGVLGSATGFYIMPGKVVWHVKFN